MKKLLLLTKTLLAAALLCVGQNAWGATKTLFSQDYQEATSVDWSCPNYANGLSLVTSGLNKYLQYYGSTENSRGLYLYANASDTYEVASLDNYTIKCDFYIGTFPNNGTNTFQFVFLGNGSTYSGNNVNNGVNTSNPVYLYIQENAVGSGACKIYVNNATSEVGTLTFETGKWYTITQVITKNALDNTKRDIVTTITDSEGNSIIKSVDGASAKDNIETTAVSVATLSYFKGFYIRAGKYQAKYGVDNISITTETDEEFVSDPYIANPVYAGANRTVTVTAGTSSKGNSVTTYYTTDGTAPSSSNYAGSFTTATKDVTITSNCTLKAITISSSSEQSSIVEKAITVGKLTLNTPSLSITDFTKSGSDYYPQYAFSSDQTSVLGNPTVTYTYTIDGTPSAGNVTEYAEAKAGTLVVSANAEGYTSATTEVTVYKYSQRIGYDFTNAEFPLNSNWTLENNNTSMKGGTYVDGDGNTIKGKRYQPADDKVNENGYLFDNVAFSYNDKSLYYFVTGLGLGYAGGSGHNTTTITINGLTANSYTVYKKQSDANPQSFSKSVVAGNNTFAMNKYSGTGAYVLQGIYVYDNVDKDVADAIADCKAFETSSEFATAIDAESFSTGAEVYAFHTAWQIAKAKASGSTDITKVIRNAAVTSTTDWVGSRVIELGSEVYDGAPDNFLIDANNQVMDTYQMIYGLPAGKYTIKAATRATAAVESGIIYVYSEGQVDKNAAGNHVGNTGGDLNHGWSWTSIDFELTSTSDVKIGYYVDATGKWASCDDWHLTKTGDIVKLNAEGYATYSANYDVEVSGAKAYTAVLDFDGKTITCSEITSNKIPAGNGVLLYGDDNADVTLSITADAEALGTNNLKATTLANGTLATKGSNNYYALDGNTFKQYTGAAFVHNKAYFEVTAGGDVLARSMSIVLGDKVTGVENVEAAAEAKAKEGKFIENGKLVIVKNGQKFNAAGAKLY